MHIFSGDDALKKVGRRQSLQHYLDVRPRRRRGDCLKPSLLVEPLHPTRNPGQRRNSILANQIAIRRLFSIRNSLDPLRSRSGAQPLRKDGVVALTERGKKLFASDGNALICHGFPP